MTAYATTADLAKILTAKELTGVSTPNQEAAIEKASELADGYLAARYTLPLVSWPSSLTRAVCDIAAYDIVCGKMVNPQDQDWTRRRRYDDAITWLEKIAANKIDPPGIEDSGSSGTGDSTFAGKVTVTTTEKRGW